MLQQNIQQSLVYPTLLIYRTLHLLQTQQTRNQYKLLYQLRQRPRHKLYRQASAMENIALARDNRLEKWRKLSSLIGLT